MVIKLTQRLAGNCHTADWAPDESCFAVSCEIGQVYLFSFEVLQNDDLDIKLSATYTLKLGPENKGDDYRDYREAIENVKFHPRSDLKLMAYAGAYMAQIVIVDYTTLQIVQIFNFQPGVEMWNTGLEFSPDGDHLYAPFSTNMPW